MLKVLDVDGAVTRTVGGWAATGQPWAYDRERYERVARERKREQQAMLDYQATGGCRMEFLRSELDDPAAAACGRCDNCTGQPWPADVPEAGASGRARPARPAGRLGRPAEDVADRHEGARYRRVRQDPRCPHRRAGPCARPPHRRRLGCHAALPARGGRHGRAGHRRSSPTRSSRCSPRGTGRSARCPS